MKDNLALEDRSRARTFRDLVIISVTAVLAFAIAYGFNLFEMIADLSREHVGWSIDEFIIVLAILAFAFGIFSLRRWRELKDEIAERRRAEKEIKKLNEDLECRTIELEATNNELEAFSYSVSHDLRTPLISIDGFSRILLRRYAAQLDDKALHFLNAIQGCTKEMQQLINDLLALSHLKRQELKISEINIGELAKSVFEELKAITHGQKLKLIINNPPSAQGDMSMIREVLLNLLSNAVKFTRKRDVGIIEVGGFEGDGENTYYVKDNGVGFDMQYKEKLFGVFQRLHSADEYEGTGIGLAIVQRIINRQMKKLKWFSYYLKRALQ